MKHLTPLILAAFLYSASQNYCKAEPVTSCPVRYSKDLKTWAPGLTVDLSTATLNPQTGKMEIHVVLSIEDVGDQLFFSSSTANMSFAYLGLSIAGPNVVEACAGIIIGVLVLVVAGVIIYVLVKTCKKLLPPDPKK